MKTLKESILKSVKAGKYGLIEEWCKKYLKSDYDITKDLKIKLIKNDFVLRYEDYDELPDYIQFEDNPELCFTIESLHKAATIKSFQGIPKVCDMFVITGIFKEIPELSIKANFVSLNFKATKINDFYFDFFETKEIESTLIANHDASFEKMHTNKIKCLRTNDGGHNGKIIHTKLLALAPKNTAPKNSYLYDNEDLFEYCKKPWPKSDKKISKFFNTIDTADLESIEIGSTEKALKYNNVWYKIEFV